MPTSNPRINVTLSVSLDTLVAEMARYSRVSKSQVLRELLEAAEPALQRAVTLMEAAAKASAAVRSRVGGQLDRDQKTAEDALAALLASLDGVTADLVTMAEAVQGKRPARRSVRAEHARDVVPAVPSGNPPASNRGVKSPPKREKVAHAPTRATRRSS